MITKNVNIISDYPTAMRFKEMSQFELDLGKGNLKQVGISTVMNISDKFVENIFNNNGFLIHKIGKYGSISFYYTNYSPVNKIHIFFDHVENELDVPFNINLEEWLSEELYKLQEKITTSI